MHLFTTHKTKGKKQPFHANVKSKGRIIHHGENHSRAIDCLRAQLNMIKDIEKGNYSVYDHRGNWVTGKKL